MIIYKKDKTGEDIKYHLPLKLIVGGMLMSVATGYGLMNLYVNKESSNIKESVKYHPMTAREKWDSLNIDDKVYFLKMGIKDIPSEKRADVYNFVVDEKYKHGKDLISKIYRLNDYVRTRFFNSEDKISRDIKYKNIKRIDSFLMEVYNGKNN